MLLFRDGGTFGFLEGRENEAGIGSVSHCEVLSMKRAMWPLFMANCAERSDEARFKSSAKHFPEVSSLSAYCISDRSWRYDLISNASFSLTNKRV